MDELVSFYLENGLRVLMHKIPFSKTIALGMWIKQGSKYENSDNNGISHIAEHMVFNKNNTSNSELKNFHL